MSVNRRNFLKIAGSSAIILPATACSTGADSARLPWRATDSYSDPMRRSLSYALLAPNPHNKQPWVVELTSETQATLMCDLDRLLPETDPYSRQITIGLGCFLEQFRIAAQEFGFKADITAFPDGYDDKKLDARPVAHLRLSPLEQAIPSPYFAHILNRRTNRTLYTEQVPSSQTLEAITHDLGEGILAGFTNAPEPVARLQDITVIASNIEFDTPRTYMESVDVMRIGARENNETPDGIALEGPMKEALHRLGFLTRKNLADMDSAMFRTGREDYARGIKSAHGFVWVNTPANTRLDQIKAGAAYLRLNLNATAHGLAMHPLSQALQEYVEMQEALGLIHHLLDIEDGARIQMFARIGYAKPVVPAPRWPLEAKLIQA